MDDKTVHAFVAGHVQKVGYRQGCRQMARSLDLFGWVRNLQDGRVELLAQGNADAIDRLVAWLWFGPASARVVSVESDIVAPDPTLRDFFIHPNPGKSS